MIGKPPEVSLKKRWLLYSGVWGIALLCCTIPDPRAVVVFLWFLPFFPLGLIAWFSPKSENLGLIALIWLAYLVHGFFILTSRNRVRFYVLFLILTTILLLNVFGCHRVRQDMNFR